MEKSKKISSEEAQAIFESKYPTPAEITDAVNEWHETLTDEAYNKIIDLAVEKNHIPTLLQMHIFMHEFGPSEFAKLTGVRDFHEQFEAERETGDNHFAEESLMKTLVKNGIDTAKKLEDAIDKFHDEDVSEKTTPELEERVTFCSFDTDRFSRESLGLSREEAKTLIRLMDKVLKKEKSMNLPPNGRTSQNITFGDFAVMTKKYV